MAILRQLGSRRETYALGRNIPESRASNPARQFKYRNLRSGAEPDGKARRADAAIHVQLCAVLFIPSTGVIIYEMAEVEASVDKIERQLAAMSMPGQHQIDAKLGNPIKHVGEISMAQKNVDRFRYYQLFNLSQLPVEVTLIVRLSLAIWIVCADQIQRLAAQYNGRTCLAQDLDALRRE